ncbi:hypothetical protein, partial [Prevotellamassilia timonensis]|uniref:hypothetical protein n=1 Tax=Prevotellamassilia timonensis TaxID=1852370 RepID=UPI003FF0CAD5
LFVHIDNHLVKHFVLFRCAAPSVCACTTCGASRAGAEVAEKTDAGRVAPIRAQFPGITVLSMVSNLLFNLFI